MGCFCKASIPPPAPAPNPGSERSEPPADPLAGAVADWLAARWLPAPPFAPDPAWLDIAWPAPPMTPASLGVLCSLVGTMRTIEDRLGLDLAIPAHVDRLARIVDTLNARTEQLAALDQDARPWPGLVNLAAQTEAIEAATAANLFQAPPAPPIGPWRALLPKVKALAPLVAIGSMLKLDWSRPEAMDRLADRIRRLARVGLPPLQDAPLVLRSIARFDALSRLRDTLGRDPAAQGYAAVRQAVEDRAQAAIARLPSGIRLDDGRLRGMPTLPPNPGLILNAPTIAAARALPPGLVERLAWKVPAAEDLPLLTIAAPVMSLAHAMAATGADPIRGSPCDRACDAARVARTPTATPGSGTGAAPAA